MASSGVVAPHDEAASGGAKLIFSAGLTLIIGAFRA